jgi:acyl-CoA reductase-like NAD-dependent aldehyde dehydrogenase
MESSSITSDRRAPGDPLADESGDPVKTMRMWIGGRWVAATSSRTFHAVNPATGQRIARFARAGEDDIARAEDSAGQAFAGWSKQAPTERSRVVAALSKVIKEHGRELGLLETAQRGTPVRYSVPGFQNAADAFEFASEAGPILMDSFVDPGPGARYYLSPRPIGVCFFVLPWHVPFRSIASKLACALTAGNTCVIECPASDSLSALKLAELTVSIGVPPGVLNILTVGDGTTDSVFSTQTQDFAATPGGGNFRQDRTRQHGRKYIPCRPDHRRPPSFIILEDANLPMSVEKTMLTVFGDGGIAWAQPGRYYIHDSLYDAFAEMFVAAVRKVVLGNPADLSTEVGPALNPAHRANFRRCIAQMRETGGTLLAGEGSSAEQPSSEGYFLSPTVLGDIVHNMSEAGNPEVFGPLALLSRFSSIDQILELTDRHLLKPPVQVLTANARERSRIVSALDTALLMGDDDREFPKDTDQERPGFGDFSYSTFLYPVFKDYTESLVRRNIPHQN